jgi:hypothetical protein
VNVFSGNAVSCTLVFVFFREIRVIVLLGCSSRVALWFTGSIHEIEFVSITGSQESVGVLAALDVDAIELSNGCILVDDLAIAEEAPHLSESHRETFFRLSGFNLARVMVVPVLQVRVVSQEDVLALLLNVSWVSFKFNKVRNVDKLFERVLFDFLLSSS